MTHIVEVKIQNNITRKTVNVPSDKTLRSIFEENDMEYNTGVVSLDGSSLPAGSMDKTLDDLGITGDRCYLMVSVKADNAASVKIIGPSCHIISNAKLEDVKTLAKYRPGVLALTEGTGAEKREVFNVFVGSGKGSITQKGAIFGAATNNEGKAMITLDIPEGTEDAKAWAEEVIGVAILNLAKVEEKFADALAEVKAEKEKVAATITVA